MIVNCPHCGKQLRMSSKVQESIMKLGSGKKIKIKCAQCSKPFGLDRSQLKLDQTTESGVKQEPVSLDGQGVHAPAFPDLSWLKDGVFENEDVVEDIPLALVLMPDIPGKDKVVKAAVKLGYRVEMALSPEDAVNKMRFVNYASVFLHSTFETGGIQTGLFHQYMRDMKMSRRRFILYVLIGEEFNTLYDLQALACSANLVVNDTEVSYMETILRKTIPEYEALFGPLMEELRIAGKE